MLLARNLFFSNTCGKAVAAVAWLAVVILLSLVSSCEGAAAVRKRSYDYDIFYSGPSRSSHSSQQRHEPEHIISNPR